MKKYSSEDELKRRILRGSKILADNVGSTLGPKGRNVILHPKGHSPIVTKDGVTVARFVSLDDPFENLAAEIIKQASLQTNEDAGDGTTTACVLANAIFGAAQRHIIAGEAPILISRGIERITSLLCDKIKEKAKRISSLSDIRNIATISANGDQTIGDLIARAVDVAGKDGAITFENSRSTQIEMEVTEGFMIGGGYLSPKFITNKEGLLAQHANARILCTDETIDSLKDLMPILAPASQEKLPLIIVCENMHSDALAALVLNVERGALKVCPIRVAGFGDERRENIRDIALVTGAKFFSKRDGIFLKDFQLSDLGYAKNVEVTRHSALFLNGAGKDDDISMHISLLEEDVKKTKTIEEAIRIQERISRLASAAVVIRVGAMTEIEMIEKRHRIEDALEAVRSAQQEGCLPGGGTALLRMLYEIGDDGTVEYSIMKQACEAPLRTICINAGVRPDVVIEKVQNEQDFFVGYNAATDTMENLIEAGIIDPAKVTRCALLNASSVAKTLLMADYAIVEEE